MDQQVLDGNCSCNSNFSHEPSLEQQSQRQSQQSRREKSSMLLASGPLPSRDSFSSLASIQSLPGRNRSRHDSLSFDTPLKTAWVGPDETTVRDTPLIRRIRSDDNLLASPPPSDSKHQRRCDNLPSPRRLDVLLRNSSYFFDDLPNLSSNTTTGLRQRKGEPVRKHASDSLYNFHTSSHSDNSASVRNRPGTDSNVRAAWLAGVATGATLPPRSPWLIPVEHPFKILWDLMTVVLSFANAYATHTAISDRKFGGMFMMFCNVWFLMDILLNFFTERRTVNGKMLRTYQSVWARYLTTWFAVDALSLFPWEYIYVQPIFNIHKRRNFWVKNFFRSKATIKVTRHLRGRHVRWFKKVVRHTKQHGVGTARLLRLIIWYCPRYLVFLRGMKGIVAVRLLRQVNYFRRLWKNVSRMEEKDDAETRSLTTVDNDDLLDDNLSGASFGDSYRAIEFNWEMDALNDCDDDDDGVPM